MQRESDQGSVHHLRSESEVTTMQQKALDQEWQQLQAKIESFFAQVLRHSVQRLEYKPQYITHLLETQPGHNQNEHREMSL
jgi:peptide deformylase